MREKISGKGVISIMGRNITIGIPRVKPPRGINKKGICWEKNFRGKEGNTKLDRDSLFEERGLVHYEKNIRKL